ncbi:ABC transporter substrate-binding protein [Sediminibacterium sp.]|uniref:ABC transporter substrate-binding protein n=1 Tax=Sediminibacterium sp. TaxID=1917865 RepID=UPI003F72E045
MRSNQLRIVSLVPSITELLFSLGLNDQVVGITKFCVHPSEWYKTKTRIGGTKNIHIEQIKALVPTLVIANKEENVKEQVEALEAFTKVHVTEVVNFADALKMIQEIGELTHKQTIAKELIQSIQSSFNDLSSLLNVQQLQSISCTYLIWQDPYMTIGGDTYINHMLSLAGFKNVFENQLRYPIISLSQIGQLNGDIIFLSSEPFPFKQKHIDELQKQFPNKLILLVDGEMFSWYGSRLVHAAKYFYALNKTVTSHLS